MKTPTDTTVPQKEVADRLRGYREKGAQQRAMPHIIYRLPYVVCPWPGCDHSIAGIDFQLELMGDQALYQKLMDAWWKRAGLVGRCPGCGSYVLFTMHDKQCVDDPGAHGDAVLPDDWHDHAYILA
jgi:hypothetical protein